MSEGVAYADIVIMALVAGFILLRLRSVLGHKIGQDPSEFFKRDTTQVVDRQEPIVQAQEKSLRLKLKEEAEEDVPGFADAGATAALAAIRAKDPQFSAVQFVQGAKAAFEMVLDAVARNDQKTLKMLLSEDLYKEVAADLDARAKEETRTETTLVSVQAKTIAAAELAQNKAKIKVRFHNEQITVVRDKDGKIVEGDASDVQSVEDEWVFERDVTAKNPNWKIIET